MDDRRDTRFTDSVVTFLAGAAAGFILGILFAPASGKETRRKIRAKAIETGEAAKQGYAKIAREAEKSLKVVKEKTTEGIDAIKDFIEKKRDEYMTGEPEKKS